MKSQKAMEFIGGCMAHLTVEMTDHAKWQLRTAMTHAVELAERDAEDRVRKKLTRWHDPKEEPPRNNVCVLLKVVDQLDNKAIYLGSREGVEYMTDGGLVFGTDFDDKSMPDMNVKVIGWREIM
ncbi:hypothetical protein [Alistipes shahii]|uniref:hypothetical protein n=1 Tax=Alistipes shahii TaxID=328814 RepID=UPI00110607FC|nr:hypothetical protein [Alistipes shahii]